MVKRWLRTAAVLLLPVLLGVAPALAAPGDFLASFGAELLNYPLNGVGLDASGKIYVNDYANGDLKTFDPSFNFLESWDATHPDREYPQYSLFLNPHSLAVQGNRVYVANTGHDVVKAYTLAGEFLFDITFPPELLCAWAPSALATDADGNVYVTDLATDEIWVSAPPPIWQYKHYCGRQVLVFDADGNFLRTVGSPVTDPDQTPGADPDTLGYPEGVAVDGQGRVYVADQHRVVIYAQDGAWLRTFDVPTTPGQWGLSMALAVDRDGRIYVTDAFSHRVLVFANDGALLATWGTPGGEDGQFNVPMGATLDPAKNRLFVTDMWNHRVQVLEAFPVSTCAGYRFGGFLPPVSLGKPFKAGSAIPVKFLITNGCGDPADAAKVTVALWKDGKKVRGATAVPGTIKGTRHFNVNTKCLAAGVYTLVVQLPDGTRQTATITLK
jgi:DNA-binding beta-propeller fold protein YncE